jgi:hypothetical protein
MVTPENKKAIRQVRQPNKASLLFPAAISCPLLDLHLFIRQMLMALSPGLCYVQQNNAFFLKIIAQ